jgi:hypothetical protein
MQHNPKRATETELAQVVAEEQLRTLLFRVRTEVRLMHLVASTLDLIREMAIAERLCAPSLTCVTSVLPAYGSLASA